MFLQSLPATRRAQVFAFAVSLLIHALVLMIPRHDPSGTASPPRLEARLAKTAAPEAVSVPASSAKPAKTKPERARILSTNKPGKTTVAAAPKWSATEKADMNRFLDELETLAKAAPKPTLAQRSLAMAREQARQQARQEAADGASLELRPNTAPPDPFSLEMYLDGLVKRLNRSAAFVKNDPRNKGVRAAAVEFKLNPDGTMKFFKVVNEGDQAEEIAFVKSVVERSIPFSPFPEDINKAARGLTMRICILPPRAGEGGFGFSRSGPGRGC